MGAKLSRMFSKQSTTVEEPPAVAKPAEPKLNWFASLRRRRTMMEPSGDQFQSTPQLQQRRQIQSTTLDSGKTNGHELIVGKPHQESQQEQQQQQPQQRQQNEKTITNGEFPDEATVSAPADRNDYSVQKLSEKLSKQEPSTLEMAAGADDLDLIVPEKKKNKVNRQKEENDTTNNKDHDQNMQYGNSLRIEEINGTQNLKHEQDELFRVEDRERSVNSDQQRYDMNEPQQEESKSEEKRLIGDIQTMSNAGFAEVQENESILQNHEKSEISGVEGNTEREVIMNTFEYERTHNENPDDQKSIEQADEREENHTFRSSENSTNAYYDGLNSEMNTNYEQERFGSGNEKNERYSVSDMQRGYVGNDQDQMSDTAASPKEETQENASTFEHHGDAQFEYQVSVEDRDHMLSSAAPVQLEESGAEHYDSAYGKMSGDVDPSHSSCVGEPEYTSENRFGETAHGEHEGHAVTLESHADDWTSKDEALSHTAASEVEQVFTSVMSREGDMNWQSDHLSGDVHAEGDLSSSALDRERAGLTEYYGESEVSGTVASPKEETQENASTFEHHGDAQFEYQVSVEDRDHMLSSAAPGQLEESGANHSGGAHGYITDNSGFLQSSFDGSVLPTVDFGDNVQHSLNGSSSSVKPFSDDFGRTYAGVNQEFTPDGHPSDDVSSRVQVSLVLEETPLVPEDISEEAAVYPVKGSTEVPEFHASHPNSTNGDSKIDDNLSFLKGELGSVGFTNNGSHYGVSDTDFGTH